MPDAYASLGNSVSALTLFSSNIHFWRETGYFDAEAEQKPLLHTWSLAVEEQFYLFVPVFLLLLARLGRLRLAFPFLLLGMLFSFAISCYGTYSYPWATFYLLPSRAWELFVGALLGFAPGGQSKWLMRWRGFLGVLGLTLILLPCYLYDHTTRFPGAAALPPVLGTALVILAGSGRDRLPLVNQALAFRPFVFVGLISYSLYLWHWPLIAFARSRCIFPLSSFVRVLLVAGGLAAAIVSWRFVETPFRKRLLLATPGETVYRCRWCISDLAGGRQHAFLPRRD